MNCYIFVKTTQWLRLLQMTLDSFLLCNMVLNLFVCPGSFCQSELASESMVWFQSQSNSNSNVKQLLLLSCFWGTFWLIWQDFPSGTTAGYLSKDYTVILTIAFAGIVKLQSCQKRSSIQTRLRMVLTNILVIFKSERDAKKQSSWEQLQQIHWSIWTCWGMQVRDSIPAEMREGRGSGIAGGGWGIKEWIISVACACQLNISYFCRSA